MPNKKMLKPDDYLNLIEEIRNTDIKSLDEFIDKVINPLRLDHENFLEKLYKDIHYLLKDIDKKGENDLALENCYLVIEDGHLKLTGYQSRLHSLAMWIHLEIYNKLLEDSPLTFITKIENFEKNYLNKPKYTPEYKTKLDKMKKSLKQERRLNLAEKESFWEKVLDSDNLELKPNIGGMGLNLNNLIKKFRK